MHKVLESNGQTALSICACGKLHFSYGQLTLHLERDEFLTFAGEVAKLVARLQQIEDGRHPVPIQSERAARCH